MDTQKKIEDFDEYLKKYSQKLEKTGDEKSEHGNPELGNKYYFAWATVGIIRDHFLATFEEEIEGNSL